MYIALVPADTNEQEMSAHRHQGQGGATVTLKVIHQYISQPSQLWLVENKLAKLIHDLHGL